MVSKVKQCWTFEVLGPSMIYNRFNREISCHCITMSPNQSVICLAPCHQTSQSFALPPCHQTSQSFDLPSTTTSLHHRITVSLHHCVSQSFALTLPPNQSVICLAPCHQTSQSFDLPSTTTSPCHCATASPHHRVTVLVSHLPCPLPPYQSVICLAPCHQTSQSFDLPPTTTSPCATTWHHVTASPC